MKEMCKVISQGCCPKCGNKSFIIAESWMGVYLVDNDGRITDYKEDHDWFKGKCTTCGSVWDMLPNHPLDELSSDFMVLTPLRKLYYEYEPAETVIMNNIPLLENPMRLKND